MNTKLRKWGMLMLLALAPLLTIHADIIKGKVVNAETGEPLEKAVVEAKQTFPGGGYAINSNETDSLGNFNVYINFEGRVVLTYRMLGFKTLRKVDYAYGNSSSDTIDVGTVKIQPTALMLQEVHVKAKMPRFTLKGDTIVFNPEAFKLEEGARLSELIRKLPGVQQKDGKLFWNNKPIRLMMNGKDMFGGDGMLGQLPAEVASKLKLYDRKSELSHHTGKDDGEEDHVLDIQVKPGFLDKWYGDVEANYMTKDHYKGQLQAHRLSDHNPHLLYLQMNNENLYVDRNINSWWGRRIDKFGKSQYGSYNYQHNWDSPYAKDWQNNNFNLSASLGHQDGWGENNSSQETFLPNTEHTFSLNRSGNHTHKLVPMFKFEVFSYTDAANTLSLKSEASYTKQHDTNKDEAAKYDYDPKHYGYFPIDATMAAQPGDALYEHLITRNRNYTTSDSEEKNLKFVYNWRHYIGKKGSFGIWGTTQATSNTADTHINRELEYLREGYSEKLWQYYHKPQHTFDTKLQAYFDYWLGDKLYLKIEDMVTFNRNSERRAIYADNKEENLKDNVPTTLNKDNAMDNLLKTWKNELSVNATIKPNSTLQILPQAKWNYIREHTDLTYGALDTTAVRISQIFEPSVQMKWKPSRKYSMDLSFRYNTETPKMLSTLGYRDNVDPLFIQMGNPDLKQSHSHTTTYHFIRMWLRQQISLAMTATYRKDINPQTLLYRYHENSGVYETLPINIKGGDRYELGLNYDQGLGVYFHLMNQANFSWTTSYGYLTLLEEGGAPELNKQRRLGITDWFELAFETDDLKISLSNNLTWGRYHYLDASYNSSPLDSKMGLNIMGKLAGFTIETSLEDDFHAGYKISDMNCHRLLWNASIEHRFHKNKWKIGLAANDILNQQRIFRSNYSAYERTENWSEMLHHYLTLSVSYRFDAKANKNKH